MFAIKYIASVFLAMEQTLRLCSQWPAFTSWPSLRIYVEALLRLPTAGHRAEHLLPGIRPLESFAPPQLTQWYGLPLAIPKAFPLSIDGIEHLP